MDPGGRIQASPAEGTLQRGERQRRVIATVHNKQVGANRGSLDSSRHHANDHLGAVLKDGHVWHSFMETGEPGRDQQDDEEKEESDERSEKEDHCPPLDETLATSWITQIGEEGLSETEAMDSFVALNEQRKRTCSQAQELKKAARKDHKFFSSRKEARNRVDCSRQPRQPTAIHSFH